MTHPHNEENQPRKDTETLRRELAAREAMHLQPEKNGHKRMWMVIGTMATVVLALDICWGRIGNAVMISKLPEKVEAQQKEINGLKANEATLWQWKAGVTSDLQHIEENQNDEKETLRRIEDKMDLRDKTFYSPHDRP